jgi:hypothetical protein
LTKNACGRAKGIISLLYAALPNVVFLRDKADEMTIFVRAITSKCYNEA